MGWVIGFVVLFIIWKILSTNGARDGIIQGEILKAYTYNRGTSVKSELMYENYRDYAISRGVQEDRCDSGARCVTLSHRLSGGDEILVIIIESGYNGKAFISVHNQAELDLNAKEIMGFNSNESKNISEINTDIDNLFEDDDSFYPLDSNDAPLYGDQNNNILINHVMKISNTGYGAFADINNDLNENFKDTNLLENDSLLFMAYGYARRSAAAALVLQGVFSMKDFRHAQKIFLGIQHSTESSISFQEQANAIATEFIQSYDHRLDSDTLKKIFLPVYSSHLDDAKTAKDLGIEFTVDDILENVEQFIKK